MRGARLKARMLAVAGDQNQRCKNNGRFSASAATNDKQAALQTKCRERRAPVRPAKDEKNRPVKHTGRHLL
jgi:hypothetical protein